LRKDLGYARKLVFGQAEIAEDFIGEPGEKLAIELVGKRRAFVAGDVLTAYFLCRVIGGAADAELYEGGVIVETVDPVVDGLYLEKVPGVRSGLALKPPCSTE